MSYCLVQGFEKLRQYIETWTEPVNVRLPPSSVLLDRELYRSVKDLADREGTSTINLISRVLQKHIDTHAAQTKGNK